MLQHLSNAILSILTAYNQLSLLKNIFFTSVKSKSL